MGIVPLVFVAILAYSQSASALDAKTYASLGGIAEYKTRVLEEWIHDRMADVHSIPLTQQYVNLCKERINRSSRAFRDLQANILNDFEVNHRRRGDRIYVQLFDRVISLEMCIDFISPPVQLVIAKPVLSGAKVSPDASGRLWQSGENWQRDSHGLRPRDDSKE